MVIKVTSQKENMPIIITETFSIIHNRRKAQMQVLSSWQDLLMVKMVLFISNMLLMMSCSVDGKLILEFILMKHFQYKLSLESLILWLETKQVIGRE